MGVPGGVAGGVGGGGVVGGLAQNVPAAAPAMQVAEDKVEATSLLARSKETAKTVAEEQVSKRGSYSYNVALEQDPKAVLQTGPGVPAWTWRSYALGWSGPVGRDHTMRLFLLSPGMNRLLTLLRLGLLAAFAAVLIAGRWPTLPLRPRLRAPRGSPVPPAPSRDRPPALSFPSRASGHRVRAIGDAERRDPAGAEGAPHPPRALRASVRHDAEPRPADRRQPPRAERRGPRRGRDRAGRCRAPSGAGPRPRSASTAPPRWRWSGSASGFLHLRLSRGVHRVEALGPVPPGDSFTLQFADPPRRARAEAPGWDVSGLRADGPAGAVDPPDAPPRRPRRDVAGRGSLRPVARGHPDPRLRRHVDRRDARPPRDARRRADRAARARCFRARRPRAPTCRRARRGGGEPRR